MKKRKVKKSLLSWFIVVLRRNKEKYEVLGYDEEYAYILTDLNARTYRSYIERAMCEKESIELHNGREVRSLNEIQNNVFGGGCFHILSKDKEKYSHFVA